MLTVADVMTRTPVMAGADATVTEALGAMKAQGISSVLVPPPLASSTEYGIVTMRDVVSKVVTENLDPDSIRLGDLMTWRLVTAYPSWSLQQAAATMAKANVRRLPVAEGAEIVGLISDTDLFTALAPRQEWQHVRLVRKERAWQRVSQTGPVQSVADVMSTPVLAIGPSASVQEAVQKMVASGISSLLVTSEREQGIVTKRDVVKKVMAHGRDPREVPVGEVMSSPVRTISSNATLEECSGRMTAERVRRFPVDHEGKIIGIISDSDILAAVMAHRWLGQRRRAAPTSYIVADVMRPSTMPIEPSCRDTISPELSLWECAAKMSQASVRQLSVVQEGKVIGIVSDTDILRALEERGGAH